MNAQTAIIQERKPCPSCGGSGGTGKRVGDYARGYTHTDWCGECYGWGTVPNGTWTPRGTSDPRQDKREAEASAMGMLQALVKFQRFSSPETYEDARKICAEWDLANSRVNEVAKSQGAGQ